MVTIVFRSRNIYGKPHHQDMTKNDLISWLKRVLEIKHDSAANIYEVHCEGRGAYTTNKCVLTLSDRQFTRLSAYRTLDNKLAFFKAPLVIQYVDEKGYMEGMPVIDISEG